MIFSKSGHASGTADKHLPLVLRIEIDKSLACKEAVFHILGSVHTGLLGDGKNALKKSHRQIAFQKGETSGDAYAVICTQRGILGNEPAVLYLITDGVFEEVVLHPGILLTHHILMRLKNESRNVLLSFARRTGYADIAYLIFFDGKTAAGRPLQKVLRHRFLVS